MREPRVELLWWEGCPSTDEALAILREEMAELGLDPGAIDAREVSTDVEARREEFVGSPTIRVDGRDVQPLSDERSVSRAVSTGRLTVASRRCPIASRCGRLSPTR
jgi:hypothetical protein